MHDLEKIMEAKKTLTCWYAEELACGKENFLKNYEAIAEMADEIKDLAEAEEKCVKACYYMELLKEMGDEEGEMSGRYGYDNWRYASGRFAPTGKGHYAGYTPFKSNVRIHEPHIDEDIRMGYPRGKKTKTGMDGAYGYEYWPSASEKGVHYDEWDMARRHYHEMGDEESKKRMNEKMSHNITEVVSQIQEMSEEASPEMRKELKEKISKVLGDANRIM